MKITKLLGLVGVILLIYILSRIDLDHLVYILASADPSLIVLSVVMLFVTIILRTYRWKIIIEADGSAISLKDCFLTWLKGFSWGAVTPARIGDFSRAKFLTERTGISLGRSFLTVLIDRVFDIAILLTCTILSVLAISHLFGVEVLSVGVVSILALIFGFCLYILTHRKLIIRILRPLFNLLVPSGVKETTRTNFNDFYKALDLLSESRLYLLASISLSILSLLANGTASYILALSLGLNISYWYILVSAVISSAVALLPISISGLGTREATYILLFSRIGIAPEQAVSLSVLTLAWNLLPALPGMGLYLLKK